MPEDGSGSGEQERPDSDDQEEPAEDSEDDEDGSEDGGREEVGGGEGDSPGGPADDGESQDDDVSETSGPPDGSGFNFPDGVCVDKYGDILVCDSGNHRIVRVGGEDFEPLAFAGEGGVEGYEDGDADTSLFHAPTAITVGPDGHAVVADLENHAIRKIDSETGAVVTAAGGTKEGSKNGPALEAEFNRPIGVACDKTGRIYVVDSGNHQIRRWRLYPDALCNGFIYERWAMQGVGGEGG